ncbi:ubiquitin-conjugating enzyme E2 variant 3 [Polyodon spathula]|uniref:ubiquitin-conjugating enzyme E2 variant 3 n=1 Tax=Polyodon spathula TaxID=7913 RepID=UPI001B7F2FCE|nr:ubiquitin-conjugating enzyme E2 variant 3 [Polyodon spathula]
MDLSEEHTKKTLARYKFRDLTIDELQKVHRMNPSLKPSVDTYTFTDSTQKDLLKLTGTVQVKYQGRSYNMPIQLWLLDSHPFTPPMCFLMPTPNMVVRVGRHVDARGRIYLPYLQNWTHPQSTVNGLLIEMVAKFEEDPPLASKTRDDTDSAELMAFLARISGGVSDMTLQSAVGVGGDRAYRPINKVTVVGGGDLAMACVMSILAKSSVDKLVLIDVSESASKGGTMDLEIFNLPKVEICRDFSASAGSRVVVVAANSWSNDQSYVSVVQTNVDLFRGIIPTVAHYSPSAVLLITSQPVDIMTHVAWKQSGLPANRVLGAGCNLDSERFHYILSSLLKGQPAGKAWVIGELSENKVAVWNRPAMATDNLPDSQKQLTDRAVEMLKGKGQRSWSVGLSIADLTHSILTDLRKTHCVSTLAKGWSGISGEAFLSLPCMLGAGGVAEISTLEVEEEEGDKVRNSAVSLHNFLQQLRI